MDLVSMRKKSVFDYRAVVFDVDGTLYFQKPFRRRMLRYLMGYVLRHPSALGDMLLLKEYREIREDWERCETDEIGRRLPEGLGLAERQFAYAALAKKTTPERIKKAVRFFMMESPLKLLPAYRDEAIYELIKALHEKKIPVAVYSDYPAKDKLGCLGMSADFVFSAADQEIGAMKPDPRGLAYIAETLSCRPEELLMIGDRYEKDGLAAKQNGVDYVILPSSKRERGRLAQMMCIERD